MNARPRTKRGQATRDRIVRTAGELVAEQGVGGFSLDELCRRSKTSKSQLYLYFPDRAELIREVARATCETVLAVQAEALAHFDTMAGIEAYLDATVALQVHRQAEGGCPLGSLAGQIAERDPEARLALADGLDRWEAGLREGLETMLERGELRADAQPAKLATQSLAALQGGMLLTQVKRDTGQIRAAADGVLALVRASLAEGAPAPARPARVRSPRAAG